MLRRLLSRSAAIALTIAAVFTLFLAVERPRFLRWGATATELTRVMPGDHLVAKPAERVTRAITIAAPPERVWPWVAQIGQDRAGFYSYEILEDLVGCEMPNETRLLPDRQSWKPGDRLWMYPARKANGEGSAPLADFEEGRRLVFSTRTIGTPPEAPYDGTWGFYVEPAAAGETRLVMRSRSAPSPGLAGWLTARLFFEPAHYAMERRMMLHLRDLAEGRIPSALGTNLMVAFWTITLVVMLIAVVQVFRRRQWRWPLFVAGAAALLFQLLTLAQPPVALAGLLVAALVVSLVCPEQRPAARAA